VLISYLGKWGKTKSLRGAEDRLFDWGDMEQPSSAAYNIIVEAQKLNDNEKLKIVALGALTNVASAILMEPSIEEKIELYWLGTSYDFEKDILKKTDFNCVMDIQAVDVLFNSQVEMHVIPVNVAIEMLFTFDEVKQQLEGKHPLCDFLIHRWYNHLDGGRSKRAMWDLGLIDAMLFPEKVTEEKIKTSPENGNREVFYYKTIDANFFRQEFYDTLLEFSSDQNN
jgi:inosine-uridine nucleoside N-ribohydrolase